jgi:hypothetical protein
MNLLILPYQCERLEQLGVSFKNNNDVLVFYNSQP